MPLMFSTNGVSNPTFGSVNVRIKGDGTSSTVVVDLKEAPFRLDFSGNYPQSIDGAVSPAGSVSLGPKGVITVTFNTPPTGTDNIVTVAMYYV